jgi:hypothetical protein
MNRLLWLGVAMSLSAVGVSAGEKNTPASPVTATLVAKETTYKLDLGGMTSDAFQKSIEDAVSAGKTVPAPPTVDLTLELKNTSDQEVKVWISGTGVQLDLDLKGPGALNVKPRVFFPQIAIAPKPVTLAPGKTHAIAIKSLKSGYRGGSIYSYWTRPGEYMLAATFKTGIAPAPKGSTTKGNFGIVTLTAAPIKLKVDGK